MSSLDSYRSRLDGLVAELAGGLGVPGMVCGVRLGDDVHVVPWGVVNVATGAPVVPWTLFQLGSITKVYTATLVMQAVQAGLVGLDEPVRSQLQEFSVADPGATIEITPRHLLTHTSGIEGDHLIDTGWNPDALARYVATLAGLGQLHPTDEAYSFCNTGYGVLGRLLEVATGDDFDKVLRRRLTRPLGCRATVTLPHHALLHSVAVGHAQTLADPPARQARWALTRANGPMGGVMAPADELLAFAALHIDEGRTASGVDLLAPAAAADMQRLHADTPLPGEAQALGWTVRPWGDAHQPRARRRHVRPAGRAPGRARAEVRGVRHGQQPARRVAGPDPARPPGRRPARRDRARPGRPPRHRGGRRDLRRPGRRRPGPTTGSTSGSRWRSTATAAAGGDRTVGGPAGPRRQGRRPRRRRRSGCPTTAR